jgi:hypothetical protein
MAGESWDRRQGFRTERSPRRDHAPCAGDAGGRSSWDWRRGAQTRVETETGSERRMSVKDVVPEDWTEALA